MKCAHPAALAALLLGLTADFVAAQSVPWPDLSSISADLTVPPLTDEAPAPGKRVRLTATGWEQSEVSHSLYLPTDWQPGKLLPVLVEYAGNGGYSNPYGDSCTGQVEGCRLGYGISGGTGFLWLCLPYVEMHEGSARSALKWWGDLKLSKRYCLTAVRETCARFGGDPARVVLCGFSRGSIGCNYLGLMDDEISELWCAFICHSHYDGVSERWPYAGADRAAALERLARLRGRPQFISHEVSLATTEQWLRSTGIQGAWTFMPIPFRNHSDAWVLRDIPARRELRAWLTQVLAGQGEPHSK